MPDPIRVLILEDKPADAELMLYELRQAGFTPDCHHVDIEPDYLAALEAKPDLILADWSLPQFSGLRALQLMNERGMDIPFIIVSGSIGEEAAVEALHQGADDYLLKDRMKRLGQAVRQALEGKQQRDERKKAEDALRASKEFAENLIETANSMVVGLDLNGKITIFNKAAVEITGYTRSELQDRNWFETIVPKDRYPQVWAEFERLTTGGLPKYFENPIRTKTGEERYIVWQNGQVIEKGNVVGTISFGMDLTERKRAEEALRSSEEKWRSLVSASPDFIALHDPEGRFLFLNHYSEGFTEKDVIGNSLYQYLLPEAVELFRSNFEKALNTWTTQHFEHAAQGDRGVMRTYEEYLVPVRGKNQESNILAIARDITERKQAEEALRSSEQRFRSLYENAMIGIYRTTPDGRILMANPALVRMLGFQSFEELAQRDLTEDIYWPTYPRQDFQKRIEQSGHTRDLESAWKRKDGSAIFVRESAHLTRDENNQPLYYEGTVEDVTERKQAEDALWESEELLVLFMRQSPIYAFIKEVTPTESRVLHASDNYQELVGSSGRDIVGKTMAELFPAEFAAKITADDREVVAKGEVLRLDEDLNGRNYTSIKFPIVQGDKTMLAGYTIDVTERKQAEDTLRESELRFRELFNRMSSGVAVCEAIDNGGDFIIKDFNPSAEKIEKVSKKDILGKRLSEVFPGVKAFGIFEVFQRVWQTGKPEYFPPNIYKDERDPGSWRESWVFRLPTGEIVAIYDNITQRKQAEEEIRQLNANLEKRVEERTLELREAQDQLVRHEKLVVLGQIAGSVGHELRNPLGIISNAIYFLNLVQPDADVKIKQYHAMIEREIQNAEKIISDLLDFARLKSLEREPVSVSALLQSVLSRFPVPESVTVTLKLPPHLPMVFADPRQLEQVLGNLVVNACQAMASGGKLTISAHVVAPVPARGVVAPVPAKKSRSQDEARDRQKEMVAIAVEDNGVGIPLENMKKIFEPLFTTKSEGIGLGLPISWKLAEANGGRIEVQSEPGKGSTFTVVLPTQDG